MTPYLLFAAIATVSFLFTSMEITGTIDTIHIESTLLRRMLVLIILPSILLSIVFIWIVATISKDDEFTEEDLKDMLSNVRGAWNGR